MWRRRKQRDTSVPVLEELRAQWRERETALRKARREEQLISKRLLRDLTEEGAHGSDDHMLEENAQSHFMSVEQIAKLIEDLQREPEQMITPLTALRHSLRRNDVRLMFTRVEDSMRVLVALFTCPFTDIQMEAARCLHELSHSNELQVSMACLPATPYLLTYLSGYSQQFTVLCLYTLGNLIVDSEEVRNRLLLQGVIPTFAKCTQSPHMDVQEALGYAFSQLLQSKEAPEKIIPMVLESGLTQDILRILLSCTEEWFGVAIEMAWCLHYIVSSHVNNALLISQGLVSKLVPFLIEKAALITKQESLDLELLICPVIRCLGNLLGEVDSSGTKVEVQDGRLLIALFVFIQHFKDEHPFMVRECLWAVNNLTVQDPVWTSALLNVNLLPALLQLLAHSKDVFLMIATILHNIADLGLGYCQQLREKGVLPCLTPALRDDDIQVARISLELLNKLLTYCPDVAGDFFHNSGLQIIELHKDKPDLQQQVQAVWNKYQELVRQ
uniref:Transmembrane and coiled-coil domains 6 n=1 Tax=Xenopus tropicalis TaxID=8364 RepID=A0A6I8S0G2_XENTR